MRSIRQLVALTVLVGVLAGCGGSGDDRPDLAVATPPPEPLATTPLESEAANEESVRPTKVSARALSAGQRARIEGQAAETGAAIRRWDEALLGCVGPSGGEDDADATCTHAAWERLVDQIELAMYYFLEHLRGMPRGACHDALAAENDILRAFWHGAAPLDLAWLDEQQRPPSGFDLETAVDLVRPVPGRVREAVTTLCAP